MYTDRIFSNNQKWVVVVIGLFALLSYFVFHPTRYIPVTGKTQIEGNTEFQLPEFDIFTNAVTNGDANAVRGVYAPGVLALRVLQQPKGDYTYVTSMAGVVTQFMPAATTGVTGLVAHNYLAGEKFSLLEIGQFVDIVYGDGSVKRYLIDDAFRYQALDPDNPYSDFIELESKQHFTSTEVYNMHYRSTDQVTFQTCISNGDSLEWGRLFVIAVPLETN